MNDIHTVRIAKIPKVVSEIIGIFFTEVTNRARTKYFHNKLSRIFAKYYNKPPGVTL